MIARATCIALAAVVVGCGSKPPPRACSTEAPPAGPSKAPLEIGMCPMDSPPDAGPPPDAAPAETTPDATNAGG